MRRDLLIGVLAMLGIGLLAEFFVGNPPRYRRSYAGQEFTVAAPDLKHTSEQGPRRSARAERDKIDNQ
jgi:hypothetical protein